MKHLIKFLCGLFLLIQVYSCSNENEFFSSEELSTSEAALRQAISDDILLTDSFTLMPVNPDSIKSKLFKTEKTNSVSPMAADYDMYFSSNMYAIDGLPFTLKARDGNKYLSASGKWQEVKWTSTGTSTDQKFYVKVLPASSGIPYLIYSYKTKTPVGVGQYTANPQEKILLVHNDESGSLYNASWDFIPSPSYPGYFAIESQSYIGQSDPNNPWSIFYHVLEVKDKNLVRYGQYTRKSQQEFTIKPDATFTPTTLTFDVNSATITTGTENILTNEYNRSIEEQTITIPYSKNFTETSTFAQIKTIDFNLTNVKFARPTVAAGRIVLPTSATPKDALYTPTTQNIAKTISGSAPIIAPARCLIELTTKIHTANVSMQYTLTAKNGTKEIKLTGTWRAKIYIDPTTMTPIQQTRFFDLDTGEEIYPSLRSKELKKN